MLKTAATYREPYKAHIARGKLEAEGIPAIVLDEHLIQIDWLYSQAIGGVKVQVPEEALKRVQEILADDHDSELEMIEETGMEPSTEEVCPKCGSSSTASRGFSLWSLVPSFIFVFPVLFRKKGRVCSRCGATWKNKK
jgi:ribosomal protein S27AE